MKCARKNEIAIDTQKKYNIHSDIDVADIVLQMRIVNEYNKLVIISK